MRASVAVFLAGIWLPLLDTWWDLDRSPDVAELRRLAPRPRIGRSIEAWMELPRAFERYYDDRFGFRRGLIRLNNRVRRIFRSNVPDTPVIIGRSDWLFVNAGGGLLDDHRGVRLYDEDELEARGLHYLRQRDWLAARGIPYLLVLAPDKHSIYPEHLPSSVQAAGDRNRTDQLLARLAAGGLEVLDLRPALEAGKDVREVYPPSGSHWNEFGAYLAYVGIQRRVASLFPGTEALPLDAFGTTVQRRGSDLGRLLGLQDEFQSDFPRLSRKVASPARKSTRGLARPKGRLAPNRQPFAYEIEDDRLPRALVFHDSFTASLMPFLREHYRRVAFYWTSFQRHVVEHEQPEIVIEIRAERQLARVLRKPPRD